MLSDHWAKVKKQRRYYGLTVVELLLVLTILAIVILVTVPVAPAMMDKYRLWKTSKDLVSGLNMARDEAVKRSSTVRVCPSANGKSCRSSGGWNQGWLVFSDGNGNGTVQDIELIQAFGAPNESVRIIGNGAVKTAASFNSVGLVPDNGSKDGEFLICVGDATEEPRIVTIDADGWTERINGRNEACKTGRS